MAKTGLTLVAMVIVVCATALSAQAQYVAPYNLVVVVLDSSVSFQQPIADSGAKGRVPVTEALRVVQKLFSDSSAARTGRRFAGVDRYVVIAADAASQVIWRGNRTELAGLTPQALLGMLSARRQFSQCTDYEAAFAAATRVLRDDAAATNRFVLTFGDLIHEPASTDYRTCAARSGEPPAGIDWETLRTASLGFYFVSTDFTLRPNQHWLKAVEGQGLRADVRDMAQTMTQLVELPPPPAAVYRPTQKQIAAAEKSWARLRRFAWTATKVVLGGVFLLTAALFAFITVARRRAAAIDGREEERNG